MAKNKKLPVQGVTVEHRASPTGVGSPPASSIRRRAGHPMTDPPPDDWSPRDVAIFEAIRKEFWLTQAKVDYDVEVRDTFRSLDMLYKSFIRSGRWSRALDVLRERIKLLAPEEHVKPVTERDRRPREADPYQEAFTELDPADREAVRKRITAFEEEKRRWTYERTGRNPDASKKEPDLDSPSPDRAPT